MAGLITSIRDVMNPHERIEISDLEKQKMTPGEIKGMLNREGLVTWGWEVSDERVVFRVYKPDQYTAKGLLEDKGIKLEKEAETA